MSQCHPPLGVTPVTLTLTQDQQLTMESRPNKTMATHALYRFWDNHHQLLYVGITASPSTRFNDHRTSKKWWDDVAAITLQPFSDRESLEAAERSAIANEKPIYNILHASKEKLTLCPACKKISTYSLTEDRFFHADESDNRPCWLRLTRGEVVAA